MLCDTCHRDGHLPHLHVQHQPGLLPAQHRGAALPGLGVHLPRALLRLLRVLPAGEGPRGAHGPLRRPQPAAAAAGALPAGPPHPADAHAHRPGEGRRRTAHPRARHLLRDGLHGGVHVQAERRGDGAHEGQTDQHGLAGPYQEVLAMRRGQA